MGRLKSLTIADNEQFLRQVSELVVFPDSDLEKDIKVLEEYFKVNERALAMAAVQLGIPKRLVYLKNTNLDLIKRKTNDLETEEDKLHNEHRVLINPEIIFKEGLTEYWEACASCLNNIGRVKRPYKIAVRYQDINGDFHEEIFGGFESTVLSHEIDHINGILHMDIAEEILVMTYEERKEFRKTHDYVILSKTGDYENLLNEYTMLKKRGAIINKRYS